MGEPESAVLQGVVEVEHFASGAAAALLRAGDVVRPGLGAFGEHVTEAVGVLDHLVGIQRVVQVLNMARSARVILAVEGTNAAADEEGPPKLRSRDSSS